MIKLNFSVVLKVLNRKCTHNLVKKKPSGVVSAHKNHSIECQRNYANMTRVFVPGSYQLWEK